MIKKLRIRNFKCYGPQGADFNLSKVNFIYGDNSVGKSSFLQFLQMFASSYDYKNQYDRAAFDRFAFKGEGQVTARVRALSESTNIPVAYDMSFLPSQGSDCYEITVNDGVTVDSAFWDSILPKNDGKDRLVHWPSPTTRERDVVGSSPLESLVFLNRVQMEISDDSGVAYIDDILNRTGVPYSCVKDKDGKIARELIHDNDFDIDVSIKDVGWGIQRIFSLAFTLQSWKAGILALEEPESNVDEAQLGALTRVLVEEALNRPHGQLIVECHSKLMVLQLAALIKEGVIGGTAANEGVRVLEVSKRATGSVADDVGIDGNGRIDWPSSFFRAEGEILRSMHDAGVGA